MSWSLTLDKEKIIKDLLDAVLKAIAPCSVKREWLESYIRPIIEEL